jgi:hypothetical protein
MFRKKREPLRKEKINPMTRQYWIASIVLTVAFSAVALDPEIVISPSQVNRTINCDEGGSVFCLDRYTRQNYEGRYIGHDEPAVLFYSSVPGSGNHNIYHLILPADPPTVPKQDGSGGTFNFQLHPTFWMGMAVCDTQSAPSPNKNGVCVPNSDTNIANNSNPRAPDYIGNHSGTAFLELQFYPPGWIATPGLVSSSRYFAALNIDSLSVNTNTGQNNNRDCLNKVGQEPVNFAVITRNGVPLAPANPLGVPFGTSNNDLSNVLVMRPGDELRVTIQDTPAGLQTLIEDLTSGQSGFIVAGPQSGFGQVDFNPAASSCTVTPYTFHPMYSTSSESTRVPWAVHSYNIAFSDEIGHFEFCNAFNTNPNSPDFLKCTVPGFQQVKLDPDDFPCANPAFFGLPSSFVPITGCIGADDNFDGTSYGNNWPGTGDFPARDPLLHPTPVQFKSPVFRGPSGALQNYDRIAFEADLPAIEPGCDVRTGAGCQNPPPGAQFYPIFSTTVRDGHQCWWQFGGPNISGTLNTFGGTSTAEYGALSPLVFAGPSGPVFQFLNYYQTLGNPCQVINP